MSAGSRALADQWGRRRRLARTDLAEGGAAPVKGSPKKPDDERADVTSGDVPPDLLARHYERLDTDPVVQANLRRIRDEQRRATLAREPMP
jgi:hypothetical protein